MGEELLLTAVTGDWMRALFLDCSILLYTQIKFKTSPEKAQKDRFFLLPAHDILDEGAGSPSEGWAAKSQEAKEIIS